jgi:DNA-binding transcriptional regulator GbsR (MarR family)
MMTKVLDLTSMDIYAMSDNDIVENLQKAYKLLDETNTDDDEDEDTSMLEDIIESLEAENQARGS